MNAISNAIDQALEGFLAAHPSEIKVTDEQVNNALLQLARVGFDPRKTILVPDMLRAYLSGKSLYLAGNSGVGKTAFFRALNDSGVAGERMVIFSLSERGDEYASIILGELKDYQDREVVIDEVGCESNWSGHRNDDLLSHIVAIRDNSSHNTHYVTNLTGEMLKERYEVRLLSRLMARERFFITGKDMRESRVNPTLAEKVQVGNWTLCADRCPKYVNGHCTLGVRIPPQALNKTPEEMCGVGEKIPYRQEHIKAEEQFKAFRASILAKYGWSVEELDKARESKSEEEEDPEDELEPPPQTITVATIAATPEMLELQRKQNEEIAAKCRQLEFERTSNNNPTRNK